MTNTELEDKFNQFKSENQQLAQSIAESQVKIAQNEGKMQLLQEMYQSNEAKEKENQPEPSAAGQADGGN